jgi:pimeloyl-ACP methyl ester carboxylesterase
VQQAANEGMKTGIDGRGDHRQDPLTGILEATGEEQAVVARIIAAANRGAPLFWNNGVCEELYVPVEGGEIRVYHHVPRRPAARRPIALVPGWGAIPESFQDFFEVIYEQAEWYFIETREKASSRLLSRRVDMSVAQNARDIQAVLDHLGLPGRGDFLLTGACWGSASILEGLLSGLLDAPTLLAVDPMHSLWFPRWALRYVAPWLPDFVTRLIKPILRELMVGDMKEPAQKRRTYAFIAAADTWKWQHGAAAAAEFELYGRLGAVRQEVFVFNGTSDKVHDDMHYPRIAREIPRGRFIYMKTEEDKRERLMGIAALEFARVGRGDGLPPVLAPFERQVR